MPKKARRRGAAPAAKAQAFRELPAQVCFLKATPKRIDNRSALACSEGSATARVRDNAVRYRVRPLLRPHAAHHSHVWTTARSFEQLRMIVPSGQAVEPPTSPSLNRATVCIHAVPPPLCCPLHACSGTDASRRSHRRRDAAACSGLRCADGGLRRRAVKGWRWVRGGGAALGCWQRGVSLRDLGSSAKT